MDPKGLQFLLLPSTGPPGAEPKRQTTIGGGARARSHRTRGLGRRRSGGHLDPGAADSLPWIGVWMASGGIARGRLSEERKSWRKNHPHGFVAKPETLPDGSVNLMVWRCVVPGKEGTDWEGGYFPLTLQFNEDYPSSPPTCKFPSGFFHVNVYDSGAVCLSILSTGWKPSITVKQILVGIQELLDNPNPDSAAQSRCYQLLTKNVPEYRNRVRQQAKKYPSLV